MSELCPGCKALHTKGVYKTQKRKNNKKEWNPDDLACSCGLTLRWTAPFFEEQSKLSIVPKEEKNEA
jgi:hypothetical protein